jgi:hypothetical protein
MCFGFFPQLSCARFLILLIIQRDIIINVYWSFTSSTHYSFQILIKLLHFDNFFKYQNMKFHDNPSNVTGVVPFGPTDIHDEANCRLLQFCERT